MKLLGWMHRKLKQNSSGEPFKDFGIGHSCNCLTGQPSLDEQEYYQKYFSGSRPLKSQKENLLHKSFTGSAEGDQDYFEDESSDVESEYFNGLLTIGTFGSETTLLVEPETPTFPETAESVSEKETNVTENDLRLINEELEKVLAADVKEEKWTDSSGRTSHVSTITLSGTDGIANGSAVCPLQEYLFGSRVELPQLTTVAKKENRTSLGELFQKTRVGEEMGDNKEVKRGEKEREKSVKKILKRMILGSSSAAADSIAVETKLNKLLQMFHRKVHPEDSTTPKKCSKPNKTDMKNHIPHDGGGSNYSREHTLPDEDSTTIHKISVSKDRVRHKSHLNTPHVADTRSDSSGSGNREYWIKTDADYLVLEL
ncbi:hypothetical protein IFM89_031090 [Coptis chinensis]|uniref:LAZY1 n=1 Tax=Coptis chinensis TaxID=261450 RepID=A0A835ITB1_9MAGN|nr:hypothetical protein IFM89_031090 [Coptis chinensis]